MKHYKGVIMYAILKKDETIDNGLKIIATGFYAGGGKWNYEHKNAKLFETEEEAEKIIKDNMKGCIAIEYKPYLIEVKDDYDANSVFLNDLVNNCTGDLDDLYIIEYGRSDYNVFNNKFLHKATYQNEIIDRLNEYYNREEIECCDDEGYQVAFDELIEQNNDIIYLRVADYGGSNIKLEYADFDSMEYLIVADTNEKKEQVSRYVEDYNYY